MSLSPSARGFLLGLACLAVLPACSPESSSPTATPAVTRPDEIIEDLKMSETSGGSRSWTLHARRAYVFEAQDRVDVEGVEVDFFDESGRKYSHLTCDRGSLNQGTNDMQAEGHVDIHTTSGVHVEASVIRFWNGPQRITSDSFVKVTDTHGSVMSGVGFESDVKVEHYRVGQVSATVRQSGKLDDAGK
jgi:LPS export ABC transporter protein LptC